MFRDVLARLHAWELYERALAESTRDPGIASALCAQVLMVEEQAILIQLARQLRAELRARRPFVRRTET